MDQVRSSFEGPHGIGKAALALQCMAEKAKGVGVLGVEPHRLSQGCGCFRQVAAQEGPYPPQPLLIGWALDAQALVPGRQLAHARQGSQRAMRHLLE